MSDILAETIVDALERISPEGRQQLTRQIQRDRGRAFLDHLSTRRSRQATQAAIRDGQDNRRRVVSLGLTWRRPLSDRDRAGALERARSPRHPQRLTTKPSTVKNADSGGGGFSGRRGMFGERGEDQAQ
jgi:hypothetical protein